MLRRDLWIAAALGVAIVAVIVGMALLLEFTLGWPL